MKNILILTSYISGHGGMEKVIKNIKKIITDSPDFKNSYNIDVLSISDGLYNNNVIRKIFSSNNI
ncbi:hypothetical protein, partial [Rosenbergiella collisarenosi]|uniref:hypothetical protein n=1 Tax=Rosenbergiella collisarenosi TaxID=1544695 RepID=UPI001F4ED8A9